MTIIPDEYQAVAAIPRRQPLRVRLRARLACLALSLHYFREDWQPGRLRRRLRQAEDQAAAYKACLEALAEALAKEEAAR